MVGKFISAFVVLSLLTLLSLYLPALIFVNGKVSLGHIAAGYLGLLLLGSATLSLGVLGSVLGKNQLVAGLLASVFIFLLFLSWYLARIVDPPLSVPIAYLSLYEKHYFPFMRGLVQLTDVVFYLSVAYLALLASTRALQSQRWH